MKIFFAVLFLAIWAPDTFGKDSARSKQTVALKAKQALTLSLLRLPGEIEIILSYVGLSQGYLDSRNRFGHIAIRIGNFVYTANQHAVLGQDQSLIYQTSLEEYFYGLDSETRNSESGSNYGIAYARDSYGLRTEGFNRQYILDMLQEIEMINRQWNKGLIKFHWRSKNCAHLTEQILAAGGLDLNFSKNLALLSRFPLHVFERYIQVVTEHSHLNVVGLKYQRIEGARPELPANLPPLNLYHPLRAIHQLLNPTMDAWGEFEISSLQQKKDHALKFFLGDSSCETLLEL